MVLAFQSSGDLTFQFCPSPCKYQNYTFLYSWLQFNCVYVHVFIFRSSTEGHFVFHGFGNVSKAKTACVCKGLWRNVVCGPPGTCWRVFQLSHMSALFLAFPGTSALISTVDTLVYISTDSEWAFPLCTSLSMLWHLFSDNNHPDWGKRKF